MVSTFSKSIEGMDIKQIMELRVMDRKEIRESMHHCEWCWNRFHHGERDKDYLTKEQFMKYWDGKVSGNADNRDEVRLQE